MSALLKEDELSNLKARAERMGITFHPNIGLSKLKEKVNTVLKGDVKTPSVAPVGESKAQKNQRLRKSASALVRVVVTCMNPNSKSKEGDYFTVSNSVVGTLKKYVPFNNDEGWHVPRIIVNSIQERECAIRYTVKNQAGNPVPKTKMIKEFNVVILEPLTQAELTALAQKQAIANNLTDQ